MSEKSTLLQITKAIIILKRKETVHIPNVVPQKTACVSLGKKYPYQRKKGEQIK